ncbi:MAG TPA: glycosyltransferase [Pseudonocardiaceae bacterium]|nr:glycosyltransferase [Pseudonocardiaceae bacterium]
MAVRPSTEPVLAVLVCHDGQQWLREALSALRRCSPRPRHVLAVDTGSTDRTAELLAEAASGPQPVLDGVLTLGRDTGFGAAVGAAVDAGVTRWGDPGKWIWLLHDDSAPEPDCLGVLLRTAELSPSAGLLGPLALDWADPRLVVEAGLSTDASGHRQTGVGPTELDWSQFGDSVTDQESFASSAFEQSTEVLAVSSAGTLIRRDIWTEIDGYDPALPLLRDDLDFGWRVNRSGHVALCVPAARLRHARAVTRGLRPPDALAGTSVRTADRMHGVRTVLVNCTTIGFIVGLPRIVVLCLLRMIGFTLLRRLSDARAEAVTVGRLLGGRAGLLAARSARSATATAGGRQVRGLLTSRTTRLRNVFRGGVASWVRRRAAADAALGRLPVDPNRTGWLAPHEPAVRPVGPAALPAGALGRRGPSRVAGLRRPAIAVAVSLAVDADPLPRGRQPSPRPRPSPVPRDGSRPDLMFVEVGRGRLAAQLLLAPPVLLVVGLTLVSLITNAGRLGTHLAGGALLPAQGVAATWSDYLASWHAVAGGTSAPAPATLAVLGALGTLLYPVGGPPTALAVLLLGDAPLAGLLAYAATRKLPVRRWVRALVAAGYALLQPAAAAVAQGRLDVVVVHILLPPVLAGVVALLTPSARRWLSSAAGTALGLAVIGAFAPLVHSLVVVVALVGFVVVPGRLGDGRRRVAALFAVVLLPLALLVPWPAVVLTDPAVLLSGVGGSAPTTAVSAARLATLDPGGPGTGSALGLPLLLVVVVAILLRPRRAVLPGVAVAVLGTVAVGLVAAQTGTALDGVGTRRFWTGAPMVLVGAGLAWALLGACRTDGGLHRSVVRLLAGLGALAVLLLAVGSVVQGHGGPLRNDAPTLGPALASELATTGRATLVLAAAGQPVRQAGGRLPAFGDDDMARVPAAPQRLARWDTDLTSGDPARTKAAIAQAATSGVLFLVLPDRATADRFMAAADDLASRVSPTSDGRPVARLQPAAGTATLISPAMAKLAVTGGQPPTVLGAEGISPVDAAPPDIAVRVSEGAPGRLLVLAADDEDGWQATVAGQPVPTVRAWGHLVAVTVPPNAADVEVDLPSTLRDALLLVQAAVLLFTLLTAIPGRRR